MELPIVNNVTNIVNWRMLILPSSMISVPASFPRIALYARYQQGKTYAHGHIKSSAINPTMPDIQASCFASKAGMADCTRSRSRTVTSATNRTTLGKKSSAARARDSQSESDAHDGNRQEKI